MHQTVNLTAQAYGGSNPSIPRKHAGVAQLARASAFQAEGRGFESRFPLFAQVAQGLSTSVVRMRSAVEPRAWALN